MPRWRPELERFNAKVSPCPLTGCWWWTASTLPKGYGLFGGGGLAHRASWRLFRGPIPYGLCVCHRCDQPGCVNPDHLFLGTYQDNADDMTAKGRQQSGDRHWARARPGLLPRGDRNGARLYPERLGRPTKGTMNGRAKLTDAQVVEMRTKHAAGARKVDLAREYGVTDVMAGRIVDRRAWIHVP